MGFKTSEYEYIRHWHKTLLQNFQYVSDQSKFSMPEYWADEPEIVRALSGRTLAGDCEEFARACMLKYMERGYKSRLVLCLTESGEGHCVCEVASGDGKEAYIADNRKRSVLPHNQFPGYKFVAVGPWNPKPADKRPWKIVK